MYPRDQAVIFWMVKYFAHYSCTDVTQFILSLLQVVLIWYALTLEKSDPSNQSVLLRIMETFHTALTIAAW